MTTLKRGVVLNVNPTTVLIVLLASMLMMGFVAPVFAAIPPTNSTAGGHQPSNVADVTPDEGDVGIARADAVVAAKAPP